MGSKKPRRGETEMWLNKRLEQQACILWSSEQKRRFQQQFPDLSNECLDDKMRTYWEALSDRDRHRYIQRARQATHFEHGKQLRRRCLTQQKLRRDDMLSKEAVLSHRLKHCTQTQLSHLFHTGTTQHQFDIIQHKLWSLQRRMFATDYRRLANFFATRLIQACASGDISPELAERCLMKSPTSGEFDAWQKNFEECGRRVMYRAIEEVEDGVDAVVIERFRLLQQQAAIQYQTLLADLINETNSIDALHVFDDGSTSARLSQLLTDLPNVDELCAKRENQQTVTDAEIDAIRRLENELSHEWFNGSLLMSIEGKQVTVPNITNKSTQKLLLLENCLKPTITPLESDDVTASADSAELGLTSPGGCCNSCEVVSDSAATRSSRVMLVEAAGHVYRMSHGIELCCGLDSPSCVLNNLLIVDKLLQLEHTELLLDNRQRSTSDSGTTLPIASQSWSDEEMLKGRMTVDSEANCCNGVPGTARMLCGGAQDAAGRTEDGIFGVDTWLTSPIEPSLSTTTIDDVQRSATSCAVVATGPLVNGELNTSDMNAEPWLLQDEFSYMNMIHDGSELGIAL